MFEKCHNMLFLYFSAQLKVSKSHRRFDNVRALPFYYQLIIMSGKQAKTCQIIAVDYFLFFSAFAGEPTSNPELYSQVTCRKESPYHGFNGHFC